MSELVQAGDRMAASASLVTGLDHVGVVSADPATLFRAYERMGFRLTPVSRHSGALHPGQKPVPWGTGNRCAMFRSGYLELLAILDTSMPCGVFPRLLQQYTGLHIIAFGCDHLDEMQGRLASRGLSVLGVAALERDLETQDGTRTAKFGLLRMDDAETPEARFNLITHYTPEFLWQPHLLNHPNGAVSLAEVIACVDDLPASVARYERILGIPPAPAGPVRRFQLSHGAFSLVDRTGLTEAVPEFRPVALPQVVAFAVATTDMDAACRCLADNDVPHSRSGDRVIVPAEAGSGAAVIFQPTEENRS